MVLRSCISLGSIGEAGALILPEASISPTTADGNAAKSLFCALCDDRDCLFAAGNTLASCLADVLGGTAIVTVCLDGEFARGGPGSCCSLLINSSSPKFGVGLRATTDIEGPNEGTGGINEGTGVTVAVVSPTDSAISATSSSKEIARGVTGDGITSTLGIWPGLGLASNALPSGVTAWEIRGFA